jgi:hypothetical protein
MKCQFPPNSESKPSMLNSKCAIKALAIAACVVAAHASHAALTVHTSVTTFNAATSAQATDTFSGGGAPAVTVLNRKIADYSFTASVSGGSTFWASMGIDSMLTTRDGVDVVTFNNFSGGTVKAIGANFWVTDANNQFIPGDMKVTAVDSLGATSTVIIAGATRSSFRGFVSDGTITSMTVAVVPVVNMEHGRFPSIDNVVLAGMGTGTGTTAPAPASAPATTAAPAATFAQLGGAAGFSSVSIGSANSYGGMSAGQFSTWNGTGWAPGGAALSQVAYGSDGTRWGVTSTSAIYRYGTSWAVVPGGLKQISVGNAANVWGVQATGNVYKWNGTTWNSIPGAFASVAVGADGTVVGIQANDSVWRWNGSTWVQLPGLLRWISVGSATNVWGVNVGGSVYKLDPTTSTWVKQTVPTGAFVGVSTAADGSTILVRNDGTLWKK